MKKWFKNIAIGAIVPGLLLLSACGGGSSEGGSADTDTDTDSAGSEEIQERTINAGIGNAEVNPQGQGLNKFKELVEEKSDGKIKVNVYFDATLGDDMKMTEALQAGTQEITIPSTSPLVGILPEFGAFDLPFVFDTAEEVDTILDGEIGQQLMDKLPDLGLVGLGYWENGFRQISNSKGPIETAEDFKGLRIRTMQNPIHLDAFEALGSNPQPMAFSEVFTALESNTIDGQENPIPTIYTQRYNEVQDYMSLTSHVYTPYIMLAGKSFWDTLSDVEKEIIQEAAFEARDFQREYSREENEKALQELEDAGMSINVVSEEERAKMAEVIAPVNEKHSEQIGSIVDDMMEELEEIRNN